MYVAIIGRDAGTGFIAKKLLESSRIKIVYHINPNIYAEANDRYIPISIPDPEISVQKSKEFILNFLHDTDLDLIIPIDLQYQLWDEFYNVAKKRNIPILMSKDVGILEWSKIIGKKALQDAGIPTPRGKQYTADEILKDFFNIRRPFVLKVDQDIREKNIGKQFLKGIGKKSLTTVVTDKNYQEEFFRIKKEINELVLFNKDQNILIEEYIEGAREISYHALMNKFGCTYIGSARDYKKRYENDQGRNDIPMGSYSPVSEFDPAIHLYAERLHAFLKKKGINYVGFLYLGILIDKNGVPVVLEINTRPGEPEIQTILSVIDNDIVNLFYATATNQPLEKILFNKKSAVSVRIVNKEVDNGNKNKSKKTDVFQFPAMSTSDIKINLSQYQEGIHSVLTTSADSINDASDKIYKYIESIDIKNYTYRSDIGYFK